MANDQYTFQDPVMRYPSISPPEQGQPKPGLDRDLEPQTARGEQSYRGTGRLNGRKALITGADSGIGAAVAIAYAREGADIALSYLPAEEPDAQAVAELVRACGQKAISIPGDISDAGPARDVVAQAARELGGLDIVLNNADRQISVENLEDLQPLPQPR